ncbi:polysaccharide biosynthesis tyrosine autokinase [bacterium]|nr:polysaccharide biosynthesis tyrosine autokinase [bacterium]RQV98261.1 MAG: polysaccharide biosynthesis tyrosine autokinase [bacterium]
MKKELTLQDYVRLIIRRRWILIASTVGVMLATGFYMLFSPPVYESASVFMLETQNLSFTEKGMMLAEQVRPLGYYQAVMRSRLYGNRVMEAFFQDTVSGIPDDYSKKEFSNTFNQDISLSTSEYTDFIVLKARATNPHIAYHMAVIATQELKNRCREIDREELQNAVNFIDEQTEISKRKLEEAESALQEFRKNTKITMVDQEGGLLNELLEMEKKLTEIQTQRQLVDANIASYRKRLKDVQSLDKDAALDDKSLRGEKFRKEIQDLEIKKQDIIQQYGINHPEITSIDNQIERKKRDYINEIMRQTIPESAAMSDAEVSELKSLQERLISDEINLYTLKNQEQYYQRLIGNFKEKHPKIMDQSIEQLRLIRAQKVAEELYTYLLQRGEESKIKAATGTGGIRIVDDPIFPQHPVPQNLFRNIIMGLVLGLGLGFGLALIKEYTDNAIYSKSDITQEFDLTVVGEIPAYGGLKPRGLPLINKARKNPRDKHLKEGPLITQMALKSGTAEAFRSLRSNLQFANVDQNIKSIVISSSNAEEGKSLTSANLAIAYALLGEDVMLVDADLRKPRLHKLLQCQKSPGLTECLIEGLPAEKVIQKTGIDHLYVVCSGKTPPNPSEILSSRRMEQFVHEIEGKGRLVIFDSAPLLPVTDTLVLAGRTDGIILIVQHGKTSRFDVEHVLEMLTNAKVHVAGAVLNQIPVTRGYGYYYYYGKSYRGYY